MAIGVLATLTIKEQCQAEFEAAFLRYQGTVKTSEAGNVFFCLHKSRTQPNTYVVMEQYLHEEALQIHTSADYYQTIPQTFGQFMAAPAHIEYLDSVEYPDCVEYPDSVE